MYPLCKKKTLTVSCTLVCESGDRVKADQSSFSADLHAVMLRHHCSEYGIILFRTRRHGHMIRPSSHNFWQIVN